MPLSKKEKILVSIVTLFLLVTINFVSSHIILSVLGVSIYNQNYEKIQNKYQKKYGNKVHPFYGQTAGRHSGFESDISVEKNFSSISTSTAPLNDQVKVLILGGSVASHLSRKPLGDVPDNLLANKLNEYFNTDRFVVYNAAFGGGKQPQQYFKLLYLEFLGFEPDIIINYDGFNEVALPLGENLPRRLNAIYPRAFDSLVFSSVYDGSCFKINNFFLSFNSWTPFIEALKWAYVLRCHKASVNGPENNFSSDEIFRREEVNYLQRVIRIWEAGSNRINDFATRSSLPYLHFIQPNQYVIGSKKLTDVEKRMLYKSATYKTPIQNNYRKLDLQNLDALLKFDQRSLFINENRTVYFDACCHFNRIGMEAIAEDIIRKGEIAFKAAISEKTQ